MVFLLKIILILTLFGGGVETGIHLAQYLHWGGVVVSASFGGNGLISMLAYWEAVESVSVDAKSIISRLHG